MRSLLMSGVLVLALAGAAGAMPLGGGGAPGGIGDLPRPHPVADFPEPRPYPGPPGPPSPRWSDPADAWDTDAELPPPPRRIEDGYARQPGPDWADDDAPRQPRCWFRPGPWGPERVCR